MFSKGGGVQSGRVAGHGSYYNLSPAEPLRTTSWVLRPPSRHSRKLQLHSQCRGESLLSVETSQEGTNCARRWSDGARETRRQSLCHLASSLSPSWAPAQESQPSAVEELPLSRSSVTCAPGLAPLSQCPPRGDSWVHGAGLTVCWDRGQAGRNASRLTREAEMASRCCMVRRLILLHLCFLMGGARSRRHRRLCGTVP